MNKITNMKFNPNLIIKESPITFSLISIVLIGLAYLVSLHPEGFQLFFNFVIITGFVILTVLLIAMY